MHGADFILFNFAHAVICSSPEKPAVPEKNKTVVSDKIKSNLFLVQFHLPIAGMCRSFVHVGLRGKLPQLTSMVTPHSRWQQHSLHTAVTGAPVWKCSMTSRATPEPQEPPFSPQPREPYKGSLTPPVIERAVLYYATSYLPILFIEE